MRRLVLVRTLSAAALMALPLLPLACSTKGDGASTTGTGAFGPRSPITLGATAPLTGDQKDLGLLVQNVLRVAEASLNGAGGILGRPVSIAIRDDASDPAVFGTAADFFLKPETAVAGVIGPSTSNAAIALQGRFLLAKRPLITPLALSPELSTIQPAGDRYLFRTEPSAALQARAAALFLTKGVASVGADGGAANGCRTFAILHYNDTSGTGRPVADEFVRAVQPLGGSVILQIEIDPNQKSFDAEARRVMTSGADCQAVLMLAAPGAQYMRNFREATKADRSRDWSKFVTLGSIAFFQRGFIANGRKNPADDTELGAAEGVYGTALDPEPDNPEYAGFKNIYDTYYPLSSNPRVVPPPAAVYDAVMLLALATQKAGGVQDGQKIRDAILTVSRGGDGGSLAKRYGPAALSDASAALKRGEEIDYQGASGSCDLDDRGDVVADHIIWHIEKNQFVTIAKIKASEIDK